MDAVIAAAIAPLSGMKPVSVGQLKSGWVQRYSAPPRMRVHALSSALYVSSVSKLDTTISALRDSFIPASRKLFFSDRVPSRKTDFPGRCSFKNRIVTSPEVIISPSRGSKPIRVRRS